MFEHMYDDIENTKVRFVGFTSENDRYDFGIVFTSKFYGKPLVVCMQTGRSALFSAEDAKVIDNIKKKFMIQDEEEATQLSIFFQTALPKVLTGEPQY